LSSLMPVEQNLVKKWIQKHVHKKVFKKSSSESSL